MRDPRRALMVVVVALLAGATAVAHAKPLPWKGDYASKTPYEPQQSRHTYEPPPEGYQPVFTQLLARHGSRALTSARDIELTKQLLAHARAAGALTDLGRALEPEVLSFEHANVTVGYGNLSGRGVVEHQELAGRLLTRLPELFAGGVASGRRIHVVTSGKDRAVDSGKNFVVSLEAHRPDLAALIDPTVTDPDLLYFFKQPQHADYQDWLAHDPTLAGKIGEIYYSARSHRVARRVLERLFTPAFVDTLGAGGLLFTDPENGSLARVNPVDAAGALYTLYQAAPGLSHEGTWGFERFVPRPAARWFAYLADAQEFYEKGPSFAGQTLTFEMARVLQDDFFDAVDALRDGRSTRLAVLRFAHAETVMPFAALLQLPLSDRQVPVEDTYIYRDNLWRGALVSPYAVNVQWDVYANAGGDVLVKMLYNERETRFKAGCRAIAAGSFFYRFDELKRCYGYE